MPEPPVKIEKLLRKERGERLLAGAGSNGERLLMFQVAPPSGGLSPEERDRLEHVGEELIQVDSPHVPRVRSWRVGEKGLVELVTADPSGVFLSEMVAEARLPVQAALSLWEQIATALVPLHERGIPYVLSHPDRLLIDRKGRVILPEAGLFPVVSGRLSGDLAHAGAHFQRLFIEPDLVPPELLRSMPCTAASDVFQSASLICRLVLGESAFGKGLTLEIYNRMLNDQVSRLAAGMPSAQQPLVALLVQCLKADPLLRPRNSSELKGRLLSFRSQKEPLAERIVKHSERAYSSRFPGILEVRAGGPALADELAAEGEEKVGEQQREVLLGQLEQLRTARQSEPKRRLGPWVAAALLLALAAAFGPKLMELLNAPTMSSDQELAKAAGSYVPPEAPTPGSERPSGASAAQLWRGVPAGLLKALSEAGLELEGEMTYVPPVVPPYHVKAAAADGREVTLEFASKERLASVTLPPPLIPEKPARIVVLYDAAGEPVALLLEDFTGKALGYRPVRR